jgi:pimeloyl-ACP methyl ester carboxylesterase
VDAPDVRYARSGDVSVAYSVVGEGPFDVVFVGGSVYSALEIAWDGPPAYFFDRLASFCRLILIDKRGTGLSDRSIGSQALETRMDDVRAVMDAVGSKRAAVMGFAEGTWMALLFAGTYPERTAGTILISGWPSVLRNDDFPEDTTREEFLRFVEERHRRWGTAEYLDELLRRFAPRLVHDESVRRWWRRFCRTSVSPGEMARWLRDIADTDIRRVLPSIRVPVLVLQHADDTVIPSETGRYMAQHIPGAELVEIPGADHMYWADPDPILDASERFLTRLWQQGEWNIVETDRVLATVLFTDIVGSTAKLAELGDRGWKELLTAHHTIIRRQLVRFRGREIDTAGDGFFASFDGPARAVRCELEISRAVAELGIQIRAGLHTGECELVDGKVGGIAVHIGARVASHAGPGQILVSSTVKDLVAGSGLSFSEWGTTELKGLPGEWLLFSVDR